MSEEQRAEVCGQAVVLEVHGRRAKVRRVGGACSSCALGSSCVSRVFVSRDDAFAVNDAGARPGDMVELGLDPRSEIKIACMLYLIPAICLVLGAAGAVWLAETQGWNAQILGPVGAVLAAAVGFVPAKLASRGKEDVLRVLAVIRGG